MWYSDAPSDSCHVLMFPSSLIHFSSSLHLLIPASPISLLLPVLSSLHSFCFFIPPLVSLISFIHTNCTCLCPGHSSVQHRILVKTWVIPILTYGCPIWFNTNHTPKLIIDKLQNILNEGLHLISGGFRTTLIVALQALSHFPPICLTMEKLTKAAA